MVETASLRVETLKQRATQRASVEVARGTLRGALDEIPKSLRVEVPDVMAAAQALGLAQHSRQLGRRVGDLLERARDLRKQKTDLDVAASPDRLEQLDLAIKEASTTLQMAEAERQQSEAMLSAAEKASQQMARMAAASIPLLTNQCPVCGQSIDPQQVEKHLRELETDISTLVEFRRSVETSAEKAKTVRERKQALQDEYALARSNVHRSERLRQNEESLVAEVTALTNDASDPITLNDLSYYEIEHWGVLPSSSVGEESLSPNHPDTSSRF